MAEPKNRAQRRAEKKNRKRDVPQRPASHKRSTGREVRDRKHNPSTRHRG